MSSSTIDHLLPGIRVGLLRRGILAETYIADYGMYNHALVEEHSDLRDFQPQAILLCLDSRSVIGTQGGLVNKVDVTVEAVLEQLERLWSIAQQRFACHVIQQTFLPCFPSLLGDNEHRLASPASTIDAVNIRLRPRADAAGVDLLAIDKHVAIDGLHAWSNPVMWHRAKQEVSLAAAPVYGDLVGRLVAARQGRSAKCLVLDLDNTVWGGVVGDDGMRGLVLGQGSALGEAFIAFQSYVKGLSERGVILAVCSKNHEAVALEAFDQHPEMLLRSTDISAFVANWIDKPANIRDIAKRLNIGLDSLVFADDNPFERELVRRELPAVSVPELPEDPALYAQTIASAGYFEALTTVQPRAPDPVGGMCRARSARAVDLPVGHEIKTSALVGLSRNVAEEISGNSGRD